MLLHVYKILFIVAYWCHTAIAICVNIGSSNGLVPDGTKLLPEPMLTSNAYYWLKITARFPNGHWAKMWTNMFSFARHDPSANFRWRRCTLIQEMSDRRHIMWSNIGDDYVLCDICVICPDANKSANKTYSTSSICYKKCKWIFESSIVIFNPGSYIGVLVSIWHVQMIKTEGSISFPSIK